MVYRYIFIVAHHLWPLCFSCNAFAKFSTASPWNKSWGPPWCFAVHPCHHQQPDFRKHVFTLATLNLTNQQIKKNGTHCWLSGWVYVLSPRFSAEWKTKTEQPKCYPQAPKAGPRLGFFPPGRGTNQKHRQRLGVIQTPGMTKDLPPFNTLTHRIYT